MKHSRKLLICSVLMVLVLNLTALAQDLSEVTRPRRVKEVTQQPVADSFESRLAYKAAETDAYPETRIAAPWVRIVNTRQTDTRQTNATSQPQAPASDAQASQSPNAPIIDQFYEVTEYTKNGKSVRVAPKDRVYVIVGRAVAGNEVQLFLGTTEKSAPDYTITADAGNGFSFSRISFPDAYATGALIAYVRQKDSAGNLSQFAPPWLFTDPKQAFLVGLAPFGIVASQQAEKFSQADPAGGFIVGYVHPNGRLDPQTGRTVRNFNVRVQGIFQAAPRTATTQQQTSDTDDTTTEETTPEVTFLSSRKSFDIEMHIWEEFRINRVFYGGPYVAIGGSTALVQNELQGEAVSTQNDAGSGAGSTTVTTNNAVSDNDMKRYFEYGVLFDVYSGRRGDANLYMQAILARGHYEALAGLAGPDNDSTHRFIGKLRIFPLGLNREFFARGTASPMFGVDINAGRGQDQVRFFVGMAFNITKFISRLQGNLPTQSSPE